MPTCSETERFLLDRMRDGNNTDLYDIRCQVAISHVTPAQYQELVQSTAMVMHALKRRDAAWDALPKGVSGGSKSFDNFYNNIQADAKTLLDTL